jgi:predicted O-linked N-acetylglucosamine transferase (SPINDLY family)
MATISEALATALAHHQAGRFNLAAEVCRRIVEAAPERAEAWHLLGVVYEAQGGHAAAVEALRRSIALCPDVAQAHYNLATAWVSLGRFPEAIACYRRALELAPDDVPTCHNLGFAHQAVGDWAAATACYRRVMELQPDDPLAYRNLGLVCQARGEWDEAAAYCRQALARKADYVEAHYDLGRARWAQGDLDEAIASFERALQLKPDYAEAHNSLGQLWYVLGETDKAAACCRRAVHFKPDYAEAHYSLANALKDQGRLDQAVASYERALELQPDLAEAHNDLATLWYVRGEIERAIACCQRALAIRPDYVDAADNLLFLFQYGDGTTAEDFARAQAVYERQLVAPLRANWKPHANQADPSRPLRLGFLSADFGRHPVGYFYLRALECLRGEACQVVCYSTRRHADEFTARFRAAAHVWRDVAERSDEALAEMIRADGIDMLFDLSSHARGNRLLVFARRPAPIQVAWAGPTGLSAMDYLLTDSHLVPPGAEGDYGEQVLRMPDAYACYEPPADAPAVNGLPALACGRVTFGSLNNLAKITPRVVGLWGEVLRAVPDSRLVLRYGGATLDPYTRNRLCGGFVEAGVAPQRIEFLGAAPDAQRLDLYQEIDIALDPFPFSGCTTTCEALWMGVPVITLPGKSYLSRQSLSVLSVVGLPDLAACDPADYVARAVALAGDPSRLAALRSKLRPQMAASPLCDAPRFAGNLMSVLRDVWRKWCSANQR